MFGWAAVKKFYEKIHTRFLACLGIWNMKKDQQSQKLVSLSIFLTMRPPRWSLWLFRTDLFWEIVGNIRIQALLKIISSDSKWFSSQICSFFESHWETPVLDNRFFGPKPILFSSHYARAEEWNGVWLKKNHSHRLQT